MRRSLRPFPKTVTSRLSRSRARAARVSASSIRIPVSSSNATSACSRHWSNRFGFDGEEPTNLLVIQRLNHQLLHSQRRQFEPLLMMTCLVQPAAEGVHRLDVGVARTGFTPRCRSD